MNIPKMDFWKFNATAVVNPVKAVRQALEYSDSVLTMIEESYWAMKYLGPKSAAHGDRMWNVSAEEAADEALDVVQELIKIIENICRKDPELVDDYEDIIARYNRLRRPTNSRLATKASSVQ